MLLTGKTAIVTGSNTGIGRVTAEELARKGARVVLACRSEEKTQPIVDAIRAAGGNAEFLALDLADFASVRAAAASFLSGGGALHLLVNNAGLAGVRGLTKDGFEMAFGTNHLGPYLFTRLLLPALESAGGARVVNVASKAHADAPGIDWEAIRRSTPSIGGLGEYAVSKLANILFTKELAKRVPRDVHTYALHPGVVASDVWRAVPWGVRHVMKLFMLTNEEGARTTLYCATSDDVAAETGCYYDACKEKTPSRVAQDEGLARELWEKSATFTGL